MLDLCLAGDPGLRCETWVSQIVAGCSYLIVTIGSSTKLDAPRE